MDKLNLEWDANKVKANLKKHKVSFEEAKTVFGDPLLITFPDPRHAAGEQRYISIGTSAMGRILIVVHTEEETTIRIISCRKVTGSERRTYEEEET